MDLVLVAKAWRNQNAAARDSQITPSLATGTASRRDRRRLWIAARANRRNRAGDIAAMPLPTWKRDGPKDSVNLPPVASKTSTRVVSPTTKGSELMRKTKSKPTREERQRKREQQAQFIAERIAEFEADSERFKREAAAEIEAALTARKN